MPRISFNWQISIGNLISVGSMLLVATFAWVNLQRDVIEHDRRITALEALAEVVIERQRSMEIAAAEIGVGVRTMERLLDEVRGELRGHNGRSAE